MKSTFSAPFLLILCLFLGACSLPKSVHEQAEAFDTQAQNLQKNLQGLKEQLFTQLKEEPFLQDYAEKENWTGQITEAEKKLGAIIETKQTQVDPKLKANKSSDANTLQTQLTLLQRNLMTLIPEAKAPLERAQIILKLKETAPAQTQEAATLTKARLQENAQLTTLAQDYIKRHPQKEADIQRRLEEVTKIGVQMETLLNQVQRQLDSATPDYAQMANDLAQIHTNQTAYTTKANDLTQTLPELDESYTLILEDMKVTYHVQIGRSSWDSYSDYDTEQLGSYPMQEVTREEYEQILNAPEPLATYRSGWGRGDFSTSIPAIRRIVNPTENWPSGHDEAEFWLEDSEVLYFHRYRKVEGQNPGQEQTLGDQLEDWTEVDEAEFMDYSGALGMSVVSKPYGMFEDEAITEPHPPGMAFVGNPAYGEWRQDSGGNSFWHYYGQYAFLNSLLGNTYGGYRYSRNDYDTWKRDSKGGTVPYYGNNNRFGTNSTYVRGNASPYSRGAYAQGRFFDRPPVTIRGQGPAMRSTGPGGGGK